MGHTRTSGMRDSFTGRMFCRLWGPAMLSSLGWALSDMADAVVVGQKLGTVGLAAIALILPVYMINCMFAHGLGLGGSVHYARLMGQGRTQEAVSHANAVFLLTGILSAATAVVGSLAIRPLLGLLGTSPGDGALYAATEDYLRVLVASAPLFYFSNVFNYYLRNCGEQRRAGAGSVTGNLCDIALNVLLVTVLDMGTRGAALSTTLGQIITIGIYLPGFFGKSPLRFGIPKTVMLMKAVRALGAGLSTSVQYLYQMIFFLLCNNLLIRMGGETAVAVFDVIQNTSYLILYLYDGTGRAMQPILSTYQGEHNRRGKKNAARLGFACGMAAGGLLIALTELWPEGLCRLFGVAGTHTEALAAEALRMYGAGAFFAGINILICSFCQACENERPAFVLETLRGAVLLLPLTLVCRRLGLSRFWLLFPLTEAGSLGVFLLMGIGGRWRMRELPEERIFQRTIPGTAGDVMDTSRALEAFCRAHGADARQQRTATMTIEEIGMAILKHGFGDRTDGTIQVTAVMREDGGEIELHLRDDACVFDPFGMKTGRARSAEELDMDSIGVLLIKKRAKEFSYRRYQGFNTLVIRM